MSRRDVQGWSGAVLPVVGLVAMLVACGGGGGSGGTDPADPRAPSGLSYEHNPVEYVQGVAIAPNAPSTTGGDPVTRYDAASLPTGLSIDKTTGVISGTPTGAPGETSSAVTASNDHGSTTVQLTIKVREPDHYIISGTLTGGLPQNAMMEVRSNSDNKLLGRAAPDESGHWFVEGATAGTWRVTNASAYARISPTSRTVTVSTGNVPGVDFYVAPSTDQQSICSIVPASTTAAIGGACVAFSATVVNWTQNTLTSVVLDVSTEQNSRSTEPVRTSLACEGTTAAGTLPPGECKVTGQFCVPSTPLVAGPAKLVLTLYRSSSSYVSNRVDISLTE